MAESKNNNSTSTTNSNSRLLLRLLAVILGTAGIGLSWSTWTATTNNHYYENDAAGATKITMLPQSMVATAHQAAAFLSSSFGIASNDGDHDYFSSSSSWMSRGDASSNMPRRKLLEEREKMVASIRIFGPAQVDDHQDSTQYEDGDDVSYRWFTTQEQRQFLQEHGRECWPADGTEEEENNTNGDGSRHNTDNLLVQRFDALSSAPFLQVEIWKFCVFYTQKGNVFWDRAQIVPLVRWQDIWNPTQSSSLQSKEGDQSTALLVTATMPPSLSYNPYKSATTTTTNNNADAEAATETTSSSWIHSSLLRLDPPYAASFCRTTLRLLLDTDVSLLTTNPLYSYKAMAQQIQNDDTGAKLLKAVCQVASPINPSDQVLLLPPKQSMTSTGRRRKRNLQLQMEYYGDDDFEEPPEFTRLPSFGLHCTIPGGYCCQVWNSDGSDSANEGGDEENTNQDCDDDDDEDECAMPILMVKHPFGTTGGLTARDRATTTDKTQHQQQLTPKSDDILASTRKRQQYPASDPNPYWSTITAVPTREDAKVVSKLETPNFFDILLRNNCLPTSSECHSCLKRYTSTTGCDKLCKKECPCYCKVLCQMRPPPKHVQAVWYVQPPLYQLPAPLPPRLIPRLVHQTWYEPLTPEKYPNMSRLQQSWKQSGWKHTFYDDAAAAKFLETHFPPPVLEAYHAIQPGAFKADLFRYCCLLIQGGVYADMDVLLETNLEHAIAPNIGFMTPIDEPGIKVGQQACLWNGFMAVAPGHPFVAKTIELVVNNIRNRFTSVDYDDMLCPDPILSAAHLWDILYTTGPCILGVAMNMVFISIWH